MAGNAEGKTGNPPEPAAAGKETGQAATIEDIAARQERTETKVDGLISKIDRVLGGGQPAPAAAADAGPAPLGLDEIKKAIRDVHAEDQAAAADADHAAEHARLKKTPEPEHQPREAMTTWKGKLQKAMFGGDQ